MQLSVGAVVQPLVAPICCLSENRLILITNCDDSQNSSTTYSWLTSEPLQTF